MLHTNYTSLIHVPQVKGKHHDIIYILILIMQPSHPINVSKTTNAALQKHTQPVIRPSTMANQAPTATPLLGPAPLAATATAPPALLRVYFANALARARLQLTFWLPTKDSTVTAMARSTSTLEQYSERRILQKASEIRMIASR